MQAQQPNLAKLLLQLALHLIPVAFPGEIGGRVGGRYLYFPRFDAGFFGVGFVTTNECCSGNDCEDKNERCFHGVCSLRLNPMLWVDVAWYSMGTSGD